MREREREGEREGERDGEVVGLRMSESGMKRSGVVVRGTEWKKETRFVHAPPGNRGISHESEGGEEREGGERGSTN